MEELVNSVNGIAEALKSGIPAWVTILAGLAPILLTIITIILSYRMDRRNRELQKMIHKQNTELQQMIHNRDAFIQSRQEILSIFNAFSESLLTLRNYGSAETVFSNEQTTWNWCQELAIRRNEIIKAFDKAKLLFNEKDLVDCLEKARDKFLDIYTCITRYTYNNLNNQTLLNARARVAAQYGSDVHNPGWLAMSPAAREELIKQCENENTKEINAKINQFSEMLSYENCDIKFKKYLEIKELTEKAE